MMVNIKTVLYKQVLYKQYLPPLYAMEDTYSCYKEDKI